MLLETRSRSAGLEATCASSVLTYRLAPLTQSRWVSGGRRLVVYDLRCTINVRPAKNVNPRTASMPKAPAAIFETDAFAKNGIA